MTYVIDPEHVETCVVHDLVDFAGKDVLEVGCGDGRLTWRYADRAASVLALDPKGREITRANQTLPARLRARVAFRVGDIATADLPAAAFDVALFGQSL